MILASISIVSILLFIVSIGLLVTIHELGHFSMAKLFNVYVNEFSIGFGPQLFHKKKGETTYSIRAIPLGGYVSMFGEGIEIEDGSVPQTRSLTGIKKWKRAIIMAAGIILNFILGYVLFFSNNAFCNQRELTNQVTVIEESRIANETDIKTGDYIIRIEKDCSINGANACSSLKKSDISSSNPSELWSSEYGFTYTSDTTPKSKDDTMTIKITYASEKDNTTSSKVATIVLHPVLDEQGNLKLNDDKQAEWEKMGVSSYFRQFRYTFGEAVRQTNKDFGENTVLIFKTLGGLFIGKNWDQIGGPVAILSTSSQVLEMHYFGLYLYLWGAISVNLAIFNLLPFPGLDGWHLLVVAIEGITRKEVPEKVKSVMSAIGLVLLFGLMIFVTGRDIIGLFK